MDKSTLDVFHNLLAALMGDESRLHLMGDHQLAPDMIPEAIAKPERAILQALYDADAKSIVPLPEAIKLMVDPATHKLVDALAQRPTDVRMIKVSAAYVGQALMEWHLAKGMAEINKLAGVTFADAQEKRDLMIDKLMVSLPLTTSASRFTQLQVADRLIEVQAQRVERRKNKQALGSVMPFAGLRELVPVLQDGDVTLLSASPKAGKTLLCAEFAMYNTRYNDSDVLWLLTETSPEIIEQRNLAAELLIPMKYLLTGAVDLREEPFLTSHMAYIQNLQETWANKGRLYLEYVPGLPASSFAAIVHRYAMMAKKRNRPLLVMIDYLQRIPATGGQSDAEALARTAHAIKTMAVAENVHVLLLSQETFDGAKGNTYGSRTPLMISQVQISVERKPAMTTIYVEDGEGNILKNAVGNDRHWQIAGTEYSHQSVMKLEVLRANNDQPGTCFVAVENPLFIVHDISGTHPSRLAPFMRQQIEAFESD